MNKRQPYIHLMHMRYLIYKDAIIKAIRSAHHEMKDYKVSVAEMIRTKAYMRALRPSSVRVMPDGGSMTSDAKLWRVTVNLTKFGLIRRIDQEVEVDLPEGVDHGYALRCKLEKLL